MAGCRVSRPIRESIPREHRAAVAVIEEALGDVKILDVVEHTALEEPWPDAA